MVRVLRDFLYAPKVVWRWLEMPLAVLFSLVYLNAILFFAGLGGNDGWGYYANLESLIIDHDWKVVNNVHAFRHDGVPLGVITQSDHARELGGAVTYYPWGHSLVYAPAFLVADKVADLDVFHFHTEKLPEGSPYRGQSDRLMTRVTGLVLWSQLLTLGLVAVLYATARRLGLSPWMAGLCVLGAWGGSPLPFYANNAMTHAGHVFFLAVALWALMAGRPKTCGLFAGLGALMRTDSAIFALIPLAFAWRRPDVDGGQGVSPLRLPRDSSLRGAPPALLAAKALSIFFLVFSFNLINWKLLNGSWLNPGAPMGLGRAPWTWPVYNVLFDPRHGYFLWFPAALPALCFLLVMAWRSWREYAVHVLLIVIMVILYGARYEYWAGGGFGQRYLSALTALLLPGFAELVKRGWGRLMVGLSLPWSLFLYAAYATKNVAFDNLTGEAGCLLSNYFELFSNPASEWIGKLVDGTRVLPLVVAHPWLLVIMILPIMALLHAGFWWSRTKG
ncbi:MAG: hypothetical protein AB7F75_03200 [Planctomycetota bacterium]